MRLLSGEHVHAAIIRRVCVQIMMHQHLHTRMCTIDLNNPIKKNHDEEQMDDGHHQIFLPPAGSRQTPAGKQTKTRIYGRCSSSWQESGYTTGLYGNSHLELEARFAPPASNRHRQTSARVL